MKATKMGRKGSVKAGGDPASPMPALKTSSVLDLVTLGGFDDCLEALKQTEDDSKRATMMSQAISHLKS